MSKALIELSELLDVPPIEINWKRKRHGQFVAYWNDYRMDISDGLDFNDRFGEKPRFLWNIARKDKICYLENWDHVARGSARTTDKAEEEVLRRLLQELCK